MAKREVIWLLIRLLGLYMLYLAANMALAYAQLLYTLALIGGTSSSIPAAFEDSWWQPLATRGGRAAVLAMLLVPVFWLGLYAALSYYLLRRGNSLFRLLNHEGGEDGGSEGDRSRAAASDRTDGETYSTWPPSIR